MGDVMNEMGAGLGPSAVEQPVGLPEGGVPAAWGSDHLVDELRRLGCRWLPMNPGSSFRGLHDSIVNYAGNNAPQLLLCHHEGIAVAMAHGYAKATRRVGFAVIHDLVGLMQGTMGVYNALVDEVPLVLIGGGGPADTRERRPIDWIHAATAQADLVRRFVKWDAEPIDLPGTQHALVQGTRIAQTEPKGPVYVTVDAAVQEQPTTDVAPSGEASEAPDGLRLDPAAASDIAAAMLGAERPAIVVGTMGYDPAATTAVVAIAEAVGAACFENEHASIIPSRFAQNLTGAHDVLAEADLVLALGVKDLRSLLGPVKGRRIGRTEREALQDVELIDVGLRDLSLRGWTDMGATTPNCRQRHLASPVRAAEAIAAALSDAASDPAAAARIEARRDALRERHEQLMTDDRDVVRRRWDETPIAPARLVAELWETVKDEPWQLLLRNTRSFPKSVWEFRDGSDYLGHSGGAGVGYGPGAVVGAALGATENGRLPVAIVGDGDLLSAPGAIWTAVHYRIPLLLVVNDNSSFYNDEGHQQAVALDRDRPIDNAWIGMRMEDPQMDFADIARGYGAWARGPFIEPGELAAAFKEALTVVRAGGVAVVHARTAPK
ncbi:thiamine pyrophosphate-binding protein [Egicoccus sp. AB-alg2]|uniref:thiamine pyrophosphate-binding protein n=1 Tax=Egicoccus sp. AB-alg2 TaxID=3242693 RepID=UPI00359ED7E0